MSDIVKEKEFGSFEEILSSFSAPYGRTLSCAHRSYWRMYPENSVPAILAAIRKGCDIIELDVKNTIDGACVLTHDSCLARCTDAPDDIAYKQIKELYYDQLKDCHLRFATGGEASIVTDEKICTLEDAIKLCEGHIMINLDHVMYDRELRDATYNELLRLTKLGYHPFEYCMFKLARSSAEEVFDWIREKKEKDGVDIIYIPWAPAGARQMMALGYKPPVYEFGYDVREDDKEALKAEGVGYFANTFDGSGQDDECGWMRLIGMGVNVIHTDEADWLPKIIRREFGEKYEVSEGKLVSYKGVTGDMILRNSVSEIGDGVFASSPKLRTMMIPDTLKKIGTRAFAECPLLTDIFLPDSVTEIGADAFVDCPKLTLHVKKGSYGEKYAAKNAVNYRVCEDYTDNYEFTFEEDKLILTKCLDIDREEIVLPDMLLGHEIYEVGRNSMRGSTAKKVTFGKYVRMIEQHCLADCPNLAEVVFGDMVNAIAVTAFEGFGRDLTFVCRPGSYPFRYAVILGIMRAHPDIPRCEPIAELDGEGSDDRPYLIHNVGDISVLSKYIAEDQYGYYANSHVKLACDIALDSTVENNFPMLGVKGAMFTGIFDGDGHTVSGVHIKVENMGAGIFGCLHNAVVKNLNVSNIISDAVYNAGGLVGCASNTRFENCHVVNAKVSGHTSISCATGGFVGFATECSFTDCTAVGVTVDSYRDGGGFGGIVESSNLYRCCGEAEDFTVVTNSSAGFIGNIYGKCNFRSCYGTASVTGNNNIAGFTGFSHCRSTAVNCFAIGIPVSRNGGRVGGFSSSKIGRIENCFYNESAPIGMGEGEPISLVKLNSEEFLAGFSDDFVPGEIHPVFKTK